MFLFSTFHHSMHIKVSFDYLYLSVEEKYTVKEREKTRKIKIQDKFPHEPNERESLIYRVDEFKASQFHLFSVIFLGSSQIW